ncbi:MAG: HEAT repeat domain-containing protein [bacterium]
MNSKLLIRTAGILIILIIPTVVCSNELDEAITRLKNKDQRRIAAQEIERIGEPALKRLTKEALNKENHDDERVSALILMGKIRSKSKQMHSRNVLQVRGASTARTPVQDDTEYVLSDIVRKDSNSRIREAAAIGLGHIGALSTKQKLKEAMDDRSVNVRMRAVWALGKMGDSSGKDLALKTIKEKDVTGKLLAMEALESIGDSSVIPELEKNLTSEDVWTRIYSKLTIKKVQLSGLEGQGKLTYLKEALSDKQFEVNEWSAQELGKEILNKTAEKAGALEILKEAAKNKKTAGSYAADKILTKLTNSGEIPSERTE